MMLMSLRCTLIVPGFASTRSASLMKLCASLPKSIGIYRIGLAIICLYRLNEWCVRLMHNLYAKVNILCQIRAKSP